MDEEVLTDGRNLTAAECIFIITTDEKVDEFQRNVRFRLTSLPGNNYGWSHGRLCLLHGSRRVCPWPPPTSEIHANLFRTPKPPEYVSNQNSPPSPSTHDVQDPIFLCTLPDQWVPLGNSCSSSVDLPSSLVVSKSSSRSPSLQIPPLLRVLSSSILPLQRYRRLEETSFPPLNTPATKTGRLEVIPTFEIDEF